MLLGLWWTLLTGLVPGAQEPAAKIAELEALVQAATESSAEGAEELRELYRSALELMRRAEAARTGAEAYRMDIEAAPGVLSSLQAELEDPGLSSGTDEEPGLDLRELEAGLSQAEAEQSVARSHLALLLQEEDTRERRLGALPEEISKARLAESALEEALQSLPEGEEHRARRIHAAAELEAARSELARLEAERAFYEAERDVLELRLWHSNLEADEPAEAHAALRIADELVWEDYIPIPTDSAMMTARIEHHPAFAQGAPVVFHLHNHGSNSWNLLEVSVSPE